MTSLIAIFARHRTAPNLLMLLVVLCGLLALLNMNVQLWPTHKNNRIWVSISWPGAGAGEIDRHIAKELDLKLNALADIESIYTISRDGSVTSYIAFTEAADMQASYRTVRSTVSSISSFPENINPPKIDLRLPTERVSRILVSGSFSDQTAHNLSELITDRLRSKGVQLVRTTGLPTRRLVVEVNPVKARAQNLNTQDVSQAISQSLKGLPGGELVKADKKLQTRASPTVENIDQLGELKIRTAGTSLRLSEIAQIFVESDKSDVKSYYPGGNGFLIQVERNVEENVLDIASVLKTELALLRAELPETIKIRQYDVRSDLISERIQLLLKNGLAGLLCVGLALFVFLNFQAALWVMVGIPTAFCITFIIMWATGQTINMVSVFTMVMILGIIVDDAIVVAEEIATRQSTGSPENAAYIGAVSMLGPVTTAILTTIAAFAPIYTMTDVFGSYVKAIPLFACAALVASLAECFLLLPGHMHVSKPRRISSFRRRFDAGFVRFANGPFYNLIQNIFRLRYLSLLLVAVLSGFAIFLSAQNLVRFQFWLNPDNNFIYANLTMSSVRNRSDLERAIDEVWEGLRKTEIKLSGQENDLVKATAGQTGAHFAGHRSPRGPVYAGILVELRDADERKVDLDEIIKTWRQEIPPITELQSLEITKQQSGPPGGDIAIAVYGQDLDRMQMALVDIEQSLRKISGVTNVNNNLNKSSVELQIALNQFGIESGFTTSGIGQALNASLIGDHIDRVSYQRQIMDFIIRSQQGASFDQTLSHITVKNHQGENADLFQISDVSFGRSQTFIRRHNKNLSATVQATVDYDKVDESAVWDVLDRYIIPAIKARHNVSIEQKGKRRERNKAFEEIAVATVIATAIMYLLLAWSTSSYLMPLAIMAILPLGMAGAVIGHYILDYKLTMLSLVAGVALGGILVNDSIILFREITRLRNRGASWADATAGGYSARLRAIFLTSLTTVVGLAPLIFESSYQANFLIPIAITISAGLTIATLTSILFVPALIAVSLDITAIWGKIFPAYKDPNIKF